MNEGGVCGTLAKLKGLEERCADAGWCWYDEPEHDQGQGESNCSSELLSLGLKTALAQHRGCIEGPVESVVDWHGGEQTRLPTLRTAM